MIKMNQDGTFSEETQRISHVYKHGLDIVSEMLELVLNEYMSNCEHRQIEVDILNRLYHKYSKGRRIGRNGIVTYYLPKELDDK